MPAVSCKDGSVLDDLCIPERGWRSLCTIKAWMALEYHILTFAMCGAAFLTKIYGERTLPSGIDLEDLTDERDGIVL